MNSVLKKYPKLALVLVNFLIIGSIVFVTELVLKTYFPYYTSLKPIINSKQHALYGWGHFPKEKIYFVNPDTGEEYWERANNKGWRGDSYSFKKKKNTFRIVILGDSEAYGAIVKKDERYAKVLEDKFQENYNVEVICLSSSGYGTDQILHVLRNEGLKYEPDLVIVQFNHNDLYDNIYFDLLSEAAQKDGDSSKLGMKPFYYDLDTKNEIVLKENPYFNRNSSTNNKNYRFKKNVLQKSEILKRLYGLILSINNRNYQDYFAHNIDPNFIKYKITKHRIKNVELVLNDDKFQPLYDKLGNHLNQQLLPSEMDSILLAFNHFSKDTLDIIKVILEDHFFQTFWNEGHYSPSPPDMTDKKWTMFFRLFDKILETTIKNNIDLAILPCIEEGSIDFALKRYAISPDSITLKNIRVINEFVQIYTDWSPTSFIEPSTPYQRAKHDAHMNKEGNEQIANDIYTWILEEYSNKLESYKK